MYWPNPHPCAHLARDPNSGTFPSSPINAMLSRHQLEVEEGVGQEEERAKRRRA